MTNWNGEGRTGNRASVVEFPLNDSIDSQAAAWIAALDSDDPAPETVAAFQAWVRQPEHRAAFERLLSLWDEMNVLTQSVPPRRKKAVRDWRQWLRAIWLQPQMLVGTAVTLMALVALALLLTPVTQYQTAVGKQRAVALPDGSTVQLNTNSHIEIDFSAERRGVTLVRGEALFEVVKDPVRPFEVYAGAGTVRAVGTTFTVFLMDEAVEVVVTEGRVELDSGSAASGRPRPSVEAEPSVKPILEVGQRAVFERARPAAVEVAQLDSARVEARLAWRHGVLAFESESLENVVREMERYTTMRLIIADPALRKKRIGGLFRAGDTQAMLEALERGFGIEAQMGEDNIVYLMARRDV